MLYQVVRRATVARSAVSVSSVTRLVIVSAEISRAAFTVTFVHITTGDFHISLAKVLALCVHLTIYTLLIEIIGI